MKVKWYQVNFKITGQTCIELGFYIFWTAVLGTGLPVKIMSQVAAVWMGLGLIIVWSLGKCYFIAIVQIRRFAPDGVCSNGDSQDSNLGSSASSKER